jgi:predicted Zn finger-like uncharacterized protein
MPKYQCPECNAVLKRADAIAAGKKIKCPKCAHVFAAVAIDEDDAVAAPAKPQPKVKKPAAPKPADAPAPKAFQDDDEGGPGVYLTAAVEEQEKVEIHYGSLRDKYHKSLKGPAMAQTVRPSNILIAWGILIGVLAVGTILVGFWPMIYGDKAVTGKLLRDQLVYIIGGVASLIVACLVCWGAGKLQSLESYPLAWMGCVLGFPIGIWGMVVLSQKDIKEAFEEVATGEVN